MHLCWLNYILIWNRVLQIAEPIAEHKSSWCCSLQSLSGRRISSGSGTSYRWCKAFFRLGYIEWLITPQPHRVPEQFTDEFVSKLCFGSCWPNTCRRIVTMDSRKNAAKKRLLKQTQIWSGEVRSGKYPIQKGSTGGNSGELCKLLP